MLVANVQELQELLAEDDGGFGNEEWERENLPQVGIEVEGGHGEPEEDEAEEEAEGRNNNGVGEEDDVDKYFFDTETSIRGRFNDDRRYAPCVASCASQNMRRRAAICAEHIPAAEQAGGIRCTPARRRR